MMIKRPTKTININQHLSTIWRLQAEQSSFGDPRQMIYEKYSCLFCAIITSSGWPSVPLLRRTDVAACRSWIAYHLAGDRQLLPQLQSIL